MVICWFSMLDFIDKHNLWINISLDVMVLGWFYFKVVRSRYLEKPQLLNMFYTKKEIDIKSRENIDSIKEIFNLRFDSLEKDVNNLSEEIKSHYRNK